MKIIPASFRALLSNRSAVEPFALLAVWANPNAIEHRLITSTTLEAKDDVASSLDSGIRMIGDQIALGKGATVSMGQAVAVDNVTKQVDWTVQVREVGAWEWK